VLYPARPVNPQHDIDSVQSDALAAIAAADDLGALEEARVRHTGRKSTLTSILAGIGSLPPQERGPVGKRANEARKAVEAALAGRQEELEARELGAKLAGETVDVTLPGDPHTAGALHIVTQLWEEIEEIFIGMGWQIADGPHVEDDFHNFTALNIPEGHPARAETDTFFIAGHPHAVLRTHTSPVQVRVMETQEPPIYVVCPGAVYRNEDIDATHGAMFHQLEGLAVDEGLSLAHLKGMLQHFVRELLGPTFEIRLRPDYFPFTEPSVEVDVLWTDRHGRRQWLELLGAGMVDPNVFGFCGIDSERWTGFAWGMGLERVAMLRHGVGDLRLLFDSDLRFLEQFR
jgi:phenylalanyl-tRNA synthetase alpha chain